MWCQFFLKKIYYNFLTDFNIMLDIVKNFWFIETESQFQLQGLINENSIKG